METIDRQEFTKLWKDDNISRVEIARHFGIPRTRTHKLAVKFGLNTKRGYQTVQVNRQRDPSPDEIARLCEEIQAGWGPNRFERECLARPRIYD